MVRRFQVLKLIACETRKGRAMRYRDLMEAYNLSLESACDHLKRLWRDRLIETGTRRPRGFKHRAYPGETVQGFRFRLTPRGWQRLQWYRISYD